MADELHIEIRNDRRIGLKFDEFPERFRTRLLAGIEKLTASLLGAVRSAVPHGATGRLEASIHEQIFNDKTKITGRVVVGYDFAKAAALEYGSRGKAFNVKAHTMRLDHVFLNRLSDPTTVMVSAYSRSSNIAAHRFLRDPAAAMQGEAIAVLSEAADQAKQDFDRA